MTTITIVREFDCIDCGKHEVLYFDCNDIRCTACDIERWAAKGRTLD